MANVSMATVHSIPHIDSLNEFSARFEKREHINKNN